MKEFEVRGYVPGSGTVAIRIFAQSSYAAGQAFLAQFPGGQVQLISQISAR